MKFLNTFALFFVITSSIFAQESYSRVKIDLEETDVLSIAKLGLEVDHGFIKKDRFLINDFSESEIDLLVENEFDFEILIPNVQSYYSNQNEEEEFRSNQDIENCNEKRYAYQTPSNYTFGSMGGYLTYDEMIAAIDLMQSKFPNLISRKQPISTILTEEGRPIYYLKVGNKPNIDEDDKPEVLYTALHHAREPNSLSQMIFYLWYLLENYETDPLVKQIVDNVELYFIPCVNPDGYIYNESTNANGGGLWRKNRAVLNGSIAGVDLNRNYGYEWGHDNEGSSGNPNSNTYRGTSAFSEPETRAVRTLCLQHNFKVALNYHTFGNLLIYPWGYNNESTPDDQTFQGLSETLTSENEYFAGTGIETVGYKVNGTSDDWMYGESSILSFTPEVGSSDYGFWPPKSAIDQLNKSALRQNLVAALILDEHAEAVVVEDNGSLLSIDIKKYSLDTNEVTIILESIDDRLTFGNHEFTVQLSHLESEIMEVSYDLDLSTDKDNSEVKFLLTKKYTSYEITDTLSIYIPVDLEEVFSDEADDMSQWTTTRWGLNRTFYVSDSASFTDSPDGMYEASSTSVLSTQETIDLSDFTSVVLEFKARWDIETDFDFAQVLISTDSLNFLPLCGKFSMPGSTFQIEGEPVYEGTQSTWIQESINLDDFIGEKIHLRFAMVADEVQHQDGLYIDDVYVKVVRKDNTTSTINTINFSKVNISPNPVLDYLKIELEDSEITTYSIFDAYGRKVIQSDVQMLDVRFLSQGIYFVKLENKRNKIHSFKFIKS